MTKKIYADPVVRSFMKSTSNIRKEHLQNTLFSLNTSKFYPNVISPLLQETFQFVNNDKRKTYYYSRKGLEKYALSQNKHSLLKKYQDIIRTKSIMILIKKQTKTLTDIDYNTKVVDKIKQIDSNIESISTENPILSTAFQKDKTLSELIKEEQSSIKMCYIPIRSILQTTEVLKLLLKQDSFKVLSIFINLDNSLIVSKEISQLLDHRQYSMGEINYDSLIKFAKEHHNETNFTKQLLTMIGEIGFLDVQVGNGFVSFNKRSPEN